MTNKKLFKCDACGNNISKKAKQCPGCGHPLKNEKDKIKEISSSLSVLVVIIIILWVWLSPSKDKASEPEPTKKEQVNEAQKEQILLDECETLVLPQVTDASTYSRSYSSSYVVKMGDDNYSIKLNFTAKDGLGQNIKFQGVCLYETADKNLKLLRVVERNR